MGNLQTENTKKSKSLQTKSYECLEDISPLIYYAERLLSSFADRYFGMSPEKFETDKLAQKTLIYEYEYIAAQIFAISNLLFEALVKCEFVGGSKNNPIIAARIRNEDEMRSWLYSQDSAQQEVTA